MYAYAQKAPLSGPQNHHFCYYPMRSVSLHTASRIYSTCIFEKELFHRRLFNRGSTSMWQGDALFFGGGEGTDHDVCLRYFASF